MGRNILITEKSSDFLCMPLSCTAQSKILGYVYQIQFMMISATDEGTDDAGAREVGKRKVF